MTNTKTTEAEVNNLIRNLTEVCQALYICERRSRAIDVLVEAARKGWREAKMALCSDQLKTREQTDAEAALNNIEGWLSEALTELDKIQTQRQA